MKNYLRLNHIKAYKIALNLSNHVWTVVLKWGYFPRDTIGKQFVRAVDSISANLAEGFGRYSKKDKIKFYRYCCGSIKESLDWNEKARIRKLILDKDYRHILKVLLILPREINHLISYTNQKLTI